jgi:sugar lactone lactonase YvrE
MTWQASSVRSFGIAERAGSATALLGEGPRWDAESRRLLWVDIEGGLLHAGDRTIEGGSMVCAVAPWAGDTVLVALAGALAAVDVERGSVRRLAEIPHCGPDMRCNDGACDAAGRFWIGTMALDERPGAGALYRYDPDGTLHTVLDGVTLSNGLGWDARGRLMYYVDSPTQRIDVFDFDAASGTLANRRPFAAIPEADGIPDGLALDDDGGIWVALHGGAEVRRLDRDGAVSGRVEVPAANVTACCFAGRRLFVTARDGLYALDVPYSGPPARPFGGPPPTP